MNEHLLYTYYVLKPFIPRSLQLWIRRIIAKRKRVSCADRWPIDERSGVKPVGWNAWPDGKRFALVLTHDADTQKGHDAAGTLADLEERIGFHSSFNFVPERYLVSAALRKSLEARGFEVGVHGLYHDGKYFHSWKVFNERKVKINRYIEEWGAAGFRTPSMLHRLPWLRELNIEYDASTFDTDPFEPQSDGLGTIFPVHIAGFNGHAGFVELPYTLPQDFTLFILLQDRTIDIWKRKLDWIVENGGMVLINTHPDYMHFGPNGMEEEEYPAQHYLDLLQYIKTRYAGQYWHVLPREMARYWRQQVVNNK